jgi:hypothetical protein
LTHFLVEKLKMHSEEYHHKTDAREVKRCESILEEAISEKGMFRRLRTNLESGLGGLFFCLAARRAMGLALCVPTQPSSQAWLGRPGTGLFESRSSQY